MSKRELPSPELLRQLLRYEPETGNLFWLPRPIEMFAPHIKGPGVSCKIWNTRFANKPALTSIGTKGYRRGEIFGEKYQAHRIIWAIQTGEWPSKLVDHINGVKTDNRWSNLRLATPSENMRNTKSRENASSRYLGVSWSKQQKKWTAQICNEYIGVFECEIEAAKSYDARARKKYGEFARPNFP